MSAPEGGFRAVMLVDIVANAREIAGGRFRPGYALSGIPAINESAYRHVVDATVSGGQTLLHFAEKPFAVVHQTLYCLSRKRFRVAALLGGEASELGLQVGVEVYFHVSSA
jgi:hypothetical protein